MGKVYQSVRGVVQGTLNRRKPEIVVSARANGDDTDLKDDAMEELEKVFADGIRKLKAAASEDQAVIANEAQQVEQVIEGLRATITGLEAKLRETEDTLHFKDLASQKLAETLNTEIRDLRSALQKKDEALEGRDSEVNDLTSKRNVLSEQVTQLEFAIQQAKGEAANQAQEAEELPRASRQPSPGWRLSSARRRRTPSIEKTLPAKTWKKLLKPRSAICKVS